MKLNSLQAKQNNQSFGMKFKLTRLNPEGDWFGADREFFNSTYQYSIIDRAVSNIKPKSDTFEMLLGLPEGEIFPNEKGMLETSYKMVVNILRKNIIVKTYDLSENKIQLKYMDYMDKLEIHEKGPCNKILDFIENGFK